MELTGHMAKQALKFSRTKPNETHFARMLAADPSGITIALAETAGQFVQEKLRELRFSEPRLNGFDAFEKIAHGYPAACRIVFTSWTQGTVDAEKVEGEYRTTEEV